MQTALVQFEPIKPPDQRRPATLPSLPAWAERCSAAAKVDFQETATGFRDVLTLPSDLIPIPEQRREMESHCDSLRLLLSQTPETNQEHETRVATAVSKVLVVLAGERKSDLAEEARSEVYLDVLEDVPCWAVEAAVRLWFKHDCGTDERGRPFDYRWAPDPGTLRKIAQQQTAALSARIGQLQRVLQAVEYVDCTEKLERGRAAMRGLLANVRDCGDLSFDEAAELGAQANPRRPRLVKKESDAA
jgi:hypothetical protein